MNEQVRDLLDRFATDLVEVFKADYGSDLDQHTMFAMLDQLNVEDELRDRMSRRL